MPTLPGVRVITLGLALTAGLTLAADQQAFLPNGRAYDGQLDSEPGGRLLFRGRRGAVIPLRLCTRVLLDSPARVFSEQGLTRRISLFGGDAFSGGLLQFGTPQVSFLIHGRLQVQIPRHAIADLDQLPEETTLLHQDFEVAPPQLETAPAGWRLDGDQQHSGLYSLRVPSEQGTWEISLPRPVSRGRVTLAFHSNVPLACEWGIDAEFEGDDHHRLRSILGSPAGTCTWSSTSDRLFNTQVLTPQPGWHTWTLLLEKDRLSAIVDQNLLASGPLPKALLTRLRIWCRPVSETDRDNLLPPDTSSPSRNAAGWIDTLRIQGAVAEPRRPKPGRLQDDVRLQTGDEWYGRVSGIDPSAVHLVNDFGKESFTWQEVRGISFRQAPRPGRMVTGLLCRCELVHRLGAETRHRDLLSGALTAITDSELTLDHPYLGTLRLPIEEVASLAPEFEGSRLIVEPGVVHLGDEVRPHFRQPVPDGTSLVRHFTLESLPAGRMFLVADVSELEPAGPQTADDAPFLQELRAGRLTTTVHLNNVSLGTLNQRMNWRVSSDHPWRIRIPLPEGTLQTGANILRIEQQSSAGSLRRYDDGEISRLCIETRQ